MSSAISRYRRVVLTIVVALLLVFALVWPTIKAHLRATILIKQLSEQRMTRMQRLLHAPIETRTFTIPSSTEPIEAHLYGRVSGAKGEGIILVHGFSPLGNDSAGLVRTAEALASTGFTVLTPNIPDLTRFLVDEQSVRMIGESTRWLAGETGRPVTVIGISFSGALVLVAAGRPQYEASFLQVVVLSTYDDLERLIGYYMTGIEPLPDGGIDKIGVENPFFIAITAMQFLDKLVPMEDVAHVREAIRKSVSQRQMGAPDDPNLFVGLTARETAEASEILVPAEPLKRRVRDALAADRGRIRQFSPHWQARSLTVPVTVVAGFDDLVIPAPESIWISKDIPHGRLRRLLITRVIQHVLVKGSNPDFISRLRRLYRMLRLIHALAPAMQAADPRW